MSAHEREFLAPHLIDSSTTAVPGASVRMAAARCRSCGRVEFPRCSRCPACYADTQPVALSPKARLTGLTAVLHQPPDALVSAPYRVGVASFPEGVNVLGLLVGPDDIPGVDGLDPTLGSPVEVVATPIAEQCTYAFRPLLT